MPLYVGDYLADTLQLTAYEHGAYLLLLMHHWQTGKLPADDGQLARVHPPHWPRIKSSLMQYFEYQEDGSWTQKRIVQELTKAAEISNKRKAAALQKHSNSYANGVQMHTHSQSPSQSPKESKNLNGGIGCEARLRHPRHGAKSKDGRFVYLKRGTTEFDAYSQDHINVIGSEPDATSDGRWFSLLGAK